MCEKQNKYKQNTNDIYIVSIWLPVRLKYMFTHTTKNLLFTFHLFTIYLLISLVQSIEKILNPIVRMRYQKKQQKSNEKC